MRSRFPLQTRFVSPGQNHTLRSDNHGYKACRRSDRWSSRRTVFLLLESDGIFFLMTTAPSMTMHKAFIRLSASPVHGHASRCKCLTYSALFFLIFSPPSAMVNPRPGWKITPSGSLSGHSGLRLQGHGKDRPDTEHDRRNNEGRGIAARCCHEHLLTLCS